MNRIQRIVSKKHPGAVFFKVRGTSDTFICKVYPGNEWEARVIKDALEQAYADERPLTSHETANFKDVWR